MDLIGYQRVEPHKSLSDYKQSHTTESHEYRRQGNHEDAVNRWRLSIAAIPLFCMWAMVDDFYRNNKDRCIMVFEFSDNSGETLLEHGDIFKNLPHITISHH